MWRLVFRLVESMPKLAWLAEIDAVNGIVSVSHGRTVELREDWCAEGVWEGPFELGNFHRVENFFGSGIRLDGEDVVFCSSVAVIDRLFHVTWRDRLLVSNSLVQLLAKSGARLDPSHNYMQETFASRHGIHRYPSAVRVLHADFRAIHQEFHCNLVFRRGTLAREVRSKPRRFQSFEGYAEALKGALRRLSENYLSPTRRNPVRAFSTLSTGYDSTAVSALVKELGVTECFTTSSEHARDSRQRESGLALAQALGLKPQILRNSAGFTALERYFLAGCTDGSEAFYHDLATHVTRHCEVAVLFTGYYGDVVWNRGAATVPFDDDMRRKDVSGLNISEARLQIGFINMPIPQLYARNLKDIVAISRSEEMRPWSLDNDYDRPIPRRIAETAGAPRNLFGIEKRAQLVYYNEPRNDDLRRQFRIYLRNEFGINAFDLLITDLLHRVDYAFSRISAAGPRCSDTCATCAPSCTYGRSTASQRIFGRYSPNGRKRCK